MSNEYIGVLTLVGQQKLAASIGGTALNLTTVRVGDGNGAPVTPLETMTDLVRRVGNAYAIVSSGRDPVNPQMWRITAVVPAADGPFDVREIGVWDAAGDLIAIAKHPLVEKRSPAQGNAVELTTDIVFPVSSTAQVSVVLASDAAFSIQQMLRAPFLVVDSATTTAPPANPPFGATYVIPAGATGAWSGYAGYLAQWNGTVWALVNPPLGHQVVAKDKTDASRYLSRTATGWTPDVPSAIQSGKWNYAAAGGTANALTVALDPPVTALAAGLFIRLKIATANTGGATLAVNGLAPVAISDAKGAGLAPGDLPAGAVIDLVYSGSTFQIVNERSLYVRKSGDTMTGPLAVPAGATGAQAPQIQEVVKKSGDTMTGGLTATGFTAPTYFANDPTLSYVYYTNQWAIARAGHGEMMRFGPSNIAIGAAPRGVFAPFEIHKVVSGSGSGVASATLWLEQPSTSDPNSGSIALVRGGQNHGRGLIGAIAGEGLHLASGDGSVAPVSRLILDETGINLRPAGDAAVTLGTATRRWGQIYSSSATIQTSDAREKLDIQKIDPEKALALITALEPISHKWVVSGRTMESVEDGFEEVMVPAMETVTVEEPTVTVVDGRAVVTLKPREERVPIFDEFPLFDPDGNPVMEEVGQGEDGEPILRQVVHREPRMVMERRPTYRTQETEIPGERIHTGFLAQQVKATLDELGLDWAIWGLADKDDPESRQWLRPEGLIPVLVGAVHALSGRVRGLEGNA